MRSGNKPAVTERMVSGCDYQANVYDDIIQSGETAADEMQGVYRCGEDNIYFCIDIVKPNAFIEVKSVFGDYESWFFESSLLQCAVYKSLLMHMEGNTLKTARFRLNEGAEEKTITVDVKQPYYLKFGNVGTFEVKVKNSKEILNFLKKKIEALTDYTSAHSFDEQWKHKEFSLLRKYFEYSKI